MTQNERQAFAIKTPKQTMGFKDDELVYHSIVNDVSKGGQFVTLL